ncbi:uncharacterized protein [Eschrichtius robustus]|uniref:uncharacterized protein n=1 Tax=Eschrichtius robustus TaxID=9764 RepID=UPI0035BFF42F
MWLSSMWIRPRGGAGRGAPRRRPPAQLSSCQGAGAGADRGMTADARRSRGLGGAQAVVGARLPSGWAEPVVRRAWGPPSGSRTCFRPRALGSGWVRGPVAAWSEAAGLLLFLPLPGSGPLVDPHPPHSPWPRCSHLTDGSLPKHELLAPLLLVIPLRPLVPLPPGPQRSPGFSDGRSYGVPTCGGPLCSCCSSGPGPWRATTRNPAGNSALISNLSSSDVPDVVLDFFDCKNCANESGSEGLGQDADGMWYPPEPTYWSDLWGT